MEDNWNPLTETIERVPEVYPDLKPFEGRSPEDIEKRRIAREERKEKEREQKSREKTLEKLRRESKVPLLKEGEHG